MMDLPGKIVDFAAGRGMFPPEGLILAAVSGGADSMCLLSVFAELSATMGFTIAAAHFNHKLRGRESDADEDFVARFCRDRDIRFFAGSGDVRSAAAGRGMGIEEAARELRYEFFDQTADHSCAVRIATAHTADDNAETVLLNLTRGAGLKGFGGIPPVRGRIIRPMLTVTRREILEYLSQRSVPFVEDSSNSLDIYSRNIIRHRVVPVLTELNPRFAEAVAASALLLREDEDYLSEAAAQYVAGHEQNGALSAHALLQLPRAVGSRVIRQIAARQTAGNGLTAGHVEEILRLCASGSPSGKVSIPGCTVRREYDRVIFAGTIRDFSNACSGFEPVELPVGETITVPGLGLKVSCRLTTGGKAPASEKTACSEKINKSFTNFLFKYDNICGKIVIRSRKTGDKIKLLGGSGTKTLKKLFIEKQIPACQRAMIPVIADDAGILAVPGIGCDTRAARGSEASDDETPGKDGDTTLEITFEETGHEK